MRFSTVVFSGVLAALSVSAQNDTSAIVSGTAPVTPAQSSQAACLSACPANNPKCRNACIVDPTGIPNPAIACINACVQGDGSAAANKAYETCQLNCRLSSAVLVASTAAPAGSTTKTGSDAAATATGTGVTGSSGTAAAGSTSSGAVKATGTSTNGATAASGASSTSGTAAATSKSAASDNVRVGATFAGVFGIFAAVFAL